MSILLTLAIRYLSGRRLRTALTTLAIVLGVAVIFSVNTLLPTIIAAFQGGITGATGQVDLAVTSTADETFSPDVLAAIRRTRGIVAASPLLRRQVSYNAIGTSSDSAPKLEIAGVDPATAQVVRQYQLTSGRFLQVADDRQTGIKAAVVAQSFAAGLKLKVGDHFSVPTTRGLTELQVVGVYATQGGDQVVMSLQTAQYAFVQPNRINGVDLALAAGADHAAVTRELEQLLGPAYRVGQPAQSSDVVGSIQASVVGLNLFGVLTLFMGAFLVFNTFRTSVVERQRDIGMLRAIGATRRTIVSLILVEAVAQGVVGTALGLGLGYLFALGMVAGVGSVMAQYMATRIQGVLVPPSALAIAIGLGIGITILASLLPALAASRVPVLAALRPTVNAESTSRRGLIVGGVIVGVGLLGILSGNPSLAGLGACVILAGLVVLAPSVVRPVARACRPALELAFATEGRLAEGNLTRQTGRAAVTASAMMIGLAIIVAATGLITSIENGFLGYLDRSLASDMIFLPPSLGLWGEQIGFDPQFESRLGRIPGIGRWASLRYAGAQVGEKSIQVLGFDPESYPKISAVTFDQGDDRAYAELASGRTAIVNGVLASAAGIKLGGTISIRTPDGLRSYRVVGVGGDYLAAKVNTVYISQKNLATDFHKTEDVILLANLAPGADRAAVRARIDSLLKDYPQITLHWGADWREEQRQTLYSYFNAFYLILGVLVFPSLLGLINTLAVGILERTREIGLLRAIGATRSQIRRMVIAESLLMGATGAALGLLAGLALGYALVTLMGASLTTQLRYSFPLAGLVAALAAALLIAVLASVLPARQATALKIVQALHYE
jgi:putative ABC transport system permease protein